MVKKKTVGKAALELALKADNKHTAIDQMEENLTDYEKEVIDCAQRGYKAYNADFFVVVLTKKERLFTNIFRNFFLHRKSCPTPEYDQTVYRYIYDADALELVWTIPDKETCMVYVTNALQIAPEEKQLLNYVIAFKDGILDQVARKLNNEPGTSQFLEYKLFKESDDGKVQSIN
jgi:hypothetical protein